MSMYLESRICSQDSIIKQQEFEIASLKRKLEQASSFILLINEEIDSLKKEIEEVKTALHETKRWNNLI